MKIDAVTFLPSMGSGGEDMVKADLWHEIHSRRKLKESKKSIARALGLHVQTVRSILKQPVPSPYQRERKGSRLLAPFLETIKNRLAAVGYCARSVYEEIKDQGYGGSYDVVRRYVSPLRAEAYPEATVRFETPPGRQGQVDWGQCWTILAGKRVKVHLFVMTLGYSRRMYAVGTEDEKLPSFIRCHVDAFDHFGGIPHEIVYDNAKTVVLERDFEGLQIKWNAPFLDFSRYYGFRPFPHKPYRPQTKGKVESGVKYVKRFLRGKEFESLAHLNEVLASWIANTADQRIHGTTHRKPAEMFKEEEALLTDHRGKPAFHLQDRVVRTVSRDCLVAFETNRYSVPYQWVGRRVEVQAQGETIHIYHDGGLIVTHDRILGTYETRADRAHYQGLIRPSTDYPEVEVRSLDFYEGLGGVQ